MSWLPLVLALVLGALVYLGQREDAWFRDLYRDATRDAATPVEAAVAARDATFRWLGARSQQDPLLSLATRIPLLRSTSAELMRPQACASFALVLANLLRLGGQDARIAQMAIGGKPAKHMLVEVWADGAWRCLDPSFDVSWTRPDGTLASCAEIADDWERFAQQSVTTTQALAFPSSYRHIRYERGGVRHTNWDAVPVLMPALRALLTRLWGPAQVDGLCLRMALLNRFTAAAAGLGLVEVLLLARVWRRRSRLAQDPQQGR